MCITGKYAIPDSKIPVLHIVIFYFLVVLLGINSDVLYVRKGVAYRNMVNSLLQLLSMNLTYTHIY